MKNNKIILLLVLLNIGVHAISIQTLKINCNNGNARDCSKLGFKYYDKKDMDKTLYYGEKACSMKYANGCFLMAILYHNVYHDKSKKFIYLKKSCDLNHIKACGILGFEKSKNKNKEDAISPLKKSCYSKLDSKDDTLPSKGMVQEVCNALSGIYLGKKNTHEATKSAKRACQLSKETGDIKATTIGNFTYCDKVKYVTGIFKPKFIQKLIRNCNNLDESACAHLGLLYLEKRGVQSNRKIEFKIDDKLCEMGSNLCGQLRGKYISSSTSSDSSYSSNSSSSSSNSNYSSEPCRKVWRKKCTYIGGYHCIDISECY